MSARLPVRKTYKLFIGGAFPRSESGRTLELEGHNVARASRKDARDAVVAARKGFAAWSSRDRLQPRPGALPAGRDDGDAGRRPSQAVCSGRREVARAIDRVVWYAGWADKLAQVLGGVQPGRRAVLQLHRARADRRRRRRSRPTSPRSTGSSRGSCPRSSAGTRSSSVASEAHPLAAIELAEAVATSDVPAGVVNVLTGRRAELAPVLAAHMDVNAIDVTGRRRGRRRARGARRRERQARRPGARGAEPLGDRRLHGAEDRLAPDRPLSTRSLATTRSFSLGHPNPPPTVDSIVRVA